MSQSPEGAEIKKTPSIFSDLDMYLIYGAHGTKEDAINTASHVPQDSIVLLEGINYSGILHPLECLGVYRLMFGKDSEKYKEVKDAIINACTVSDIDIIGHNNTPDWPDHEREMVKQLAEKDCVVVLMDFMASHEDDTTISHKTKIDNKQIGELMVKGSQLLGGIGSLPYDSGASFYQAREKQLFELTQINNVREQFGIQRAENVLRQYKHYPDFAGEFQNLCDPDIAQTPAYLIFGAMHAKSLTKRLKDRDVIHPKIIMNVGTDSTVFAESTEDLKLCLRSTIAKDAFLLIKLQLDGMFGNKDSEYRKNLLKNSQIALARFDDRSVANDKEYTDYLNDAVDALRGLKAVYTLTGDELDDLEKKVDMFIQTYIDPSHDKFPDIS